MLFSLDRIEDNVAVLIADDGTTRCVSLSDLPAGASEGKMYRMAADAYVEDSLAEQSRREQIQALQNSLRKR